MADAHIFPKSIFKRVKAAQGEEGFMLAIDRDGTKRPRRVRIGEYDPGILCFDCEHRLSPIDDRGFRALMKARYIPVRVYRKGQLLNRYSDEASAWDIRAFLYFTLLKAGWSTRESYRHVQLTPNIENHLRRTVEEGLEPDGYKSSIFLFKHGLVEPNFLSTPTIYSGAITVWPASEGPMFQLVVNDTSALIFMGEKPSPFERIARFELRNDRRVHVLRSEQLDASMEKWITDFVSNRLRTGG